MSDVTAAPCRPVTTEEIEHLNELGWVQLKAFVDPDVVGGVLELAREAMGDDADGNPIPPGSSRPRPTASSASTTSTPT